MKTTDQIGREVNIPFPPRRIVSVVPSQTELLSNLQLEEEVIGITKFCIHPESWFRNKKRVGGTKDLDLQLIRSLSPDLIIANKEENDESQIVALSKDFPVWVSDIKNLESALDMILRVGQLTDRNTLAEHIHADIQKKFNEIPPYPTKRCAYLIWNNPIMTVNSDTFIHDMLRRCGLENVFGGRTESRYPVISLADIQKQQPDLLLLSSEPFPFSDKHLSQFQEHLPDCRVQKVDGEMFSWYGSRMRHFDTGIFNF